MAGQVSLVPVDHDPFAPVLTPVDHDPFADAVSYANSLPDASTPPGTQTLSAYDPSWSERIGAGAQDLMSWLGAPKGYSQDFGQKTQTVAGMVPGVGQAISGNDAVRDASAGNYGQATLNMLGMVPIPGGMGEKAMVESLLARNAPIKALPSSRSLALPDAPTKVDMVKHGRVENVPLSDVKNTQNTMKWEQFNKGDHPEELIPGYGDKPVAVRKEDGEYLIFDGHHRTVLAVNDGKSTLPMYVIDAKNYAPQFAGRAPVKPKLSDEELLAELNGP